MRGRETLNECEKKDGNLVMSLGHCISICMVRSACIATVAIVVRAVCLRIQYSLSIFYFLTTQRECVCQCLRRNYIINASEETR